MNAEIPPLSIENDPREVNRRNELLQKITKGDPFAPGELQFRRVLGERGLGYEQIQQSIVNAFLV
ncbi:MAG: hypothetical protein K9M57_09945 [Phycisphaerae bacterium]|nr:hypothetical protein [Phycisphaerae bacterium]